MDAIGLYQFLIIQHQRMQIDELQTILLSHFLLDGDNTIDDDIVVSDDIKISNDEYHEWNDAINRIGVSENILKCINFIRKAITNVHIGQTDEHHNVYVSDRRWKNIIRLLRTSAFIHDRSEVSLEDLLPIYNCLWQEPEEAEGIRTIVIQALFHEYTSIFAYLREDLSNDIRVNRQHRATEKARKSMKVFDSNKKIYDNYYYHGIQHLLRHVLQSYNIGLR